ncbi:MAG: class I SAM-dependent methyltransferase [Patescibacteria group bacterium]
MFKAKFKNIIKKILYKKDKNVFVNKNGTEFEVNNWILSEFVVREIIPIVKFHPFPLNELMLMSAAVCFIKPTYIFEWGTHFGKSARIFYETAHYFNIQTEIHSIDLPENIEHNEHPHKERGKFVKHIKKVHLHLGDGMDTSLGILKESKNEKIIPLFFLDGDHSYESVKRELNGIFDQYPQSNILIHDTFLQSEKSGYNIGPYEAIEEFLKDKKDKFTLIDTKTGLPGMTLLLNKKI